MTDLAELRRLAEQAIAWDPPWELIGDTLQPLSREWWNAANPAAILSLLDEVDRQEKLVGPEWRGLLDDLRAAEQRVAALEEGLRGLEQKAKTGAWHEKVRGGYLWAIDDARQLLQASAQDTSDR